MNDLEWMLSDVIQMAWGFDDPFFKFEEWCKANGFEDVANCEPENVNLERLHLAIEAYRKTEVESV